MHANVFWGFFNTVGKTAVISLFSLHLAEKYYHHVQLQLLQHNMKFHPDQLKSVRGSEAKRFCFAPSKRQGYLKWYKKVEVIT